MKKSNDSLFGREEEIKLLKEMIIKSTKGKPCLAFVSGLSGSGKTALVKYAVNTMKKEKDIFIYSKFNEHSANIPYDPFIQLARGLIQYMLSVPKIEKEINKKKLVKIIGQNSQALFSLIPELEYIFDNKVKAGNIDAQRYKGYFESVFQKIVKEMALKNHPIIMFIDDLQWADESSLKLIEYICENLNKECFFLICAFRECDKIKILSDKIRKNNSNYCFEQISVTNFTYLQTYEYISNYYAKIADINDITNILFKNTLGNPFYLNQIKLYIENNHIMYSNYEEFLISKDVIDIIIEKIIDLPDETKKCLNYAAVIGNTFSLELLAQVMNISNQNILLLLDKAFLAGIIIPTKSYNVFEFTHDKFRETLLQMSDEVKQLYLIIGRKSFLYYKDKLNDSILINILYYFVQALELIECDEEKIELSRYFSLGANMLLKASAYMDALYYFKIAIELIEDKSSNNCYLILFDAYLGYANALFLDEQYQQAEVAFETALSYAQNKIDCVKVLKSKVMLYYSIGENEKAIRVGIEALAKLEVRIPIEPSKNRILLEVMKSKLFFKDFLIEKDINEISIEKEILLDLLVALVVSSTIVNPRLYYILIARITVLSIRYGDFEYASLGLNGYALISGVFLNDYEQVKKLKQKSQEILTKIGRNKFDYLINFINAGFINYWVDDWQNNLVCFDRAYNAGMEIGENLFAANILPLKIIFLFNTGLNFDKLITESNKAYEQAMNIKAIKNAYFISCMTKVFRAIKIQQIEYLEEEELVRHFQKEYIMMYFLAKMQIYFLNEKYDEALELVLETNKREDVVLIFSHHVEYLFYQSLLITLSDNCNGMKYKVILHNNLKKLQKLFESCPFNFAHKFYLVSAEIMRIKEKYEEATDLYKKAISSAAESGFIQNEAIASELAGKYFYSVGDWKLAETCINNAYLKYMQWGADGKLKALEQKYPYLAMQKRSMNVYKLEIKKNNLYDRAAEAFRIIVAENDFYTLFNRLMDIIFDIASVCRSCLLLEKNDELHVFLMKNNRDSSADFNKSILYEHKNLPKKMIYYTFNTNETVKIKYYQEKGIFVNDSYINDNPMKSFFCFPLSIQDVLLGVLYLEKNSDSEECSTECIETIKTLLCHTLLLEKLHHSIKSVENKKVANYVAVEELTAREKEILSFIALGKANKEIANELDLSVNTIKTHVLSIYGKLNVNRRSQAALIAKDLNII
ncbi:helix-turn-helix transcriptional regulator [Anaerotignum sp.]|uniref:helix-turn-helix transcriptional regulator n=1 Tax=Anaerotignum sp. TaxID=2039241 RepID=UPI0027147F86|nr:helix-turn-helix transcriptional regulator [Anaerotignum sp.]